MSDYEDEDSPVHLVEFESTVSRYGEEMPDEAPRKGKKGRSMQNRVFQDPFNVPSKIFNYRETDGEEWKPEDKDLPLYVLMGRLKYIPPPLNKVVKIFLSSTFTDMYVERNYLYMNVYPRLQNYCRLNHNLEFQVVDMRWGVRDEASLDHSGPKTCMDELKSCQELSLGPNFVCLLGQRYGSRALQAEIDKSEFDTIIQSLSSLTSHPEIEDVPAATALLTEWYRADENGVPPVMVLMPLNEREQVIEPADFQPIADNLHKALRIGVTQALKDKKFEETQAMKYFWSVTEEEVYRGILSQPNAKDHTLCFERQLVDIDLHHKKVSRFVEIEEPGKINQATTALLETLVDKTKKHLGDENCAKFDNIKWNERGGTNEESLAEYLKEFGKLFEERVIMLIDRAASKVNPLQEHKYANLLTEIAEHDYQAKAKLKTFQGRQDIMDSIKQYIMSRSNKPYVMYGESGYGKTSLLAVASVRVFDWIGDDTSVIVVRRFLGTTPDSTNVGSLLASVTNQIRLACDYQPPHTEDPMQKLLFTLIALPRHIRLVIFLDSLDQLSSYGKAHTLLWLPMFFPDNVKIIVSTLPKDHGLLDLMKMRNYTENQFVEVNILETALSMKLMNDWLMAADRRLSEAQFSVVESRFKEDANTSPLYIKLIYDVVVKLRSYVTGEVLSLKLKDINSPVKCIRYIYTELMRKNGNLLVHRLFSYLHLSNLGLTENELVDLISLDDEVLNDVFQFSAPPLRRLPASLWARIRNSIQEYIVTREANGGKVIAWYHRQFVEVGDTVFKDELPPDYDSIEPQEPLKKPDEELKKLKLDDDDDDSEDEAPAKATGAEGLQTKLRENMVNYFTGVWANGKKKPFRYTKYLTDKLRLESSLSEEDRFVPAMPNVQNNGRPNLRKLGQLPNLLIKLDRVEEFFTEVFGNVEALIGLFSMYSWSDIYEIADNISFDNYKAIGKDKDEPQDSSAIKHPFQIVIRSFLLTSALACAYPKMLGPLVLGRLLPFAAGSRILRDFVNDVYEKGPRFNSFVCPHVQLEGVGSYTIFEMPNDHVGACNCMIEVTPNDRHFILTLSKKAVLINMEDGNIQMRYMPPDLKRGDEFHLVGAANPFNKPEEVVACTRLVPKIYIFSLSQFDIGEIIDCRQVTGCSEMQIQALQVTRLFGEDDSVAIMVHGNAHDGMLVYDVKTQALLFRFQNNKPILFMTNIDDQEYDGYYFLSITQPSKMTLVRYEKVDLNELKAKRDKERSKPQQEQKPVAPFTFTPAAEISLALPGDSLVTAYAESRPTKDTSNTEKGAAFATEDGNLYAGILGVRPKWSRILLDSPAHDIDFSVKSVQNDNQKLVFSVCTKYYAYIIGFRDDSYNSIFPESVESSRIVVLAKLKIHLTKLALVDDSVYIGYHLGQLYVLKVDDEKTKGDMADIRVHRKFDAHSRPITGMIVNEDIAVMVLTAAADGSVKVFHAGMNIHPYISEATTFHRMGVPVHKISGTSSRTVSLSSESNVVNVWDTQHGKIVENLEHTLQEEDTLVEVVGFDDRIVTATCKGEITFWDLEKPEEPFHQVTLSQFHQMTRGHIPYEVLVKCASSWHKFDVKTGQITDEKIYQDRTIMKHNYVNSQLCVLQILLEEEDLLIEIIENGMSDTINITQEPALSNERFKDYFCCENILVLVYLREVVFYNWKQRQVLDTEKINKAVLIPSLSNTLILKSNVTIQSYQIKQGMEKMSSAKLLDKQDLVKITPNGQHVITIEMKKMLNMYRIGDLSTAACIGQYSMYGEIEKVSFTDDSAYIVMGIADTRLFYLMLCDVTVKGHQERASALMRTEFTPEEKRRGREMVSSAGQEGDSSEEEGTADDDTRDNINILKPHYMDQLMAKAEYKTIQNYLNQGYRPLRALRAARCKKRVAQQDHKAIQE